MNNFSKEEQVAFEQILEGFNDKLILSRNISVYKTNSAQMERSNNVVWRPMPYIAQSRAGTDQTGNFVNNTQLSVPSPITIFRSSTWTMTSNELNDALQEKRLGEAARQKLASDINISIMDVAADQGTLVVKRTSAASGFDDVAKSEEKMNEIGVDDNYRYLALSTKDYNGMASNLASRTLGNSKKSLNAYERAYVNDIASFETYKLDYANNLQAALGTAVVVNGASQFHVPQAIRTAVTGETSNVDNRTQNLNITVGGGTVRKGDCFTLLGVNSVHLITKRDTGELKTFRVIDPGTGGTGTIRISPAIISNEGGSDAEAQYQNVTDTPADGAAITFLNTATTRVNPFWHKYAIELLPGYHSIPTDSGVAVMRGSTDQGIELVLQRFYDIKTMTILYRLDCFFGVVMTQPEMAGIILFSQI